ncbi:unnamed protein product [Rotaria magnacalcarata]|uniref:Uncharacterized protein n=1 Tax=Rotaria magnacalcarata TaxID=392030 RepID=A0A815EH73_9BILA|nr:unnamed protein product [Rotaria magnacalcarata]
MYQKLIIQLYGQLAIRYIFHPISVQSVRQYDFLKIPLSQEQHFLFCYSPNQQNVEISPNRLSNNADEYELTNLVLTAIYYTLFGLRHCAFRGKYFRLGTIHEGSASCNIACNSELSTIDNGRKLYTIRSAISLVKSIDQSLVKGNLVAELDPRICNLVDLLMISYSDLCCACLRCNKADVDVDFRRTIDEHNVHSTLNKLFFKKIKYFQTT